MSPLMLVHLLTIDVGAQELGVAVQPAPRYSQLVPNTGAQHAQRPVDAGTSYRF